MKEQFSFPKGDEMVGSLGSHLDSRLKWYFSWSGYQLDFWGGKALVEI